MTVTARARAHGVGSKPGAAERRHMQRHGYLLVPRFFDAETVDDLSRWTDELAAAPELSGRHWVYREQSADSPGRPIIQRIENFCPFHEGFASLIERGTLRRWVGVLMGGPVVLFKDKINFKMPGGAGFLPHQDQQAGWSRYAPLFLTAMVSLDATTPANGCLEIASRGEAGGLLGEEWQPLEAGSLDLSPVPTSPGDVIFFDSFVPHASQPNRSDAPRRVLYLTFNLASHGDQRSRYYADKHAAFPPDIDRAAGKTYVFRV